MSELRLLVVANQLLGWSQNFITRELVMLQKLGVQIRVATRSIDERSDLSPGETSLVRSALRLAQNPFLPGPLARHVVYALSEPRAYGRAWRHLARFDHERVQGRVRSLVCLFRAASAARDVRKFGPDLIHAHFLTAPAETALYLSQLCNVPWSATAHAMDIYRDNSGNGYKIAHARFLTTCTEANRSYLAAMAPEHTAKIRRIYHGLEDPTRIPQNESARKPFLFLAVGRMVKKKGFDHLLTACSLLRARTTVPFRCRLVGDGELLQHFRDRVRDEGLDEIVDLPGRSPVTAMTDHYSSASAMVVPSVITADGDRDGIPNVCLEAMSYGLPIIASEVSGLPEVVNEGKNGFMVPPGESEALTDAMFRMLELDDLSPLGAESRRIIIESFNVETNVRTFLATVESFLRDE